MRRFELEGRANFDRWSLQALYGNYDKQPELGFLTRREGILGGASVKVNQNWVVHGAARYDLDADQFDQTRIGVGYIDDCFILALNYITSYSYSGNVRRPTTASCCSSVCGRSARHPGQPASANVGGL